MFQKELHYFVFADCKKEKTKGDQEPGRNINGGDEWVFRIGPKYARAPDVFVRGRRSRRCCAGCREQRLGLFVQGRTRRPAAQVERTACFLPISPIGKKGN